MRVFNFYKDNKISAHFTLSPGRLRRKWMIWRDHQIEKNKDRGQDWYDRYFGEQSVVAFISDKEEIYGLQSVGESNEFMAIYELLKNRFFDAECPSCDVVAKLDHSMNTDTHGELLYFNCPMCKERLVSQNGEPPRIAAK